MTTTEKEVSDFYHNKQWIQIIKQNHLLSDDALLYLVIHFNSLIDRIEDDGE